MVEYGTEYGNEPKKENHDSTEEIDREIKQFIPDKKLEYHFEKFTPDKDYIPEQENFTPQTNDPNRQITFKKPFSLMGVCDPIGDPMGLKQQMKEMDEACYPED